MNEPPDVPLPMIGTREWFEHPTVQAWRKYLGDDVPINRGCPTVRQIQLRGLRGRFVEGGPVKSVWS